MVIFLRYASLHHTPMHLYSSNKNDIPVFLYISVQYKTIHKFFFVFFFTLFFIFIFIFHFLFIFFLFDRFFKPHGHKNSYISCSFEKKISQIDFDLPFNCIKKRIKGKKLKLKNKKCMNKDE